MGTKDAHSADFSDIHVGDYNKIRCTLSRLLRRYPYKFHDLRNTKRPTFSRLFDNNVNKLHDSTINYFNFECWAGKL